MESRHEIFRVIEGGRLYLGMKITLEEGAEAEDIIDGFIEKLQSHRRCFPCRKH